MSKDNVSKQDMIFNIDTLYRNATPTDVFEGTHWYDIARAFASDVARRYLTNVNVVACVIAAFSANQSWKGNMTLTERYFSGNKQGLTRAIAMADNAVVANALGNDPFDAIIGAKINPFARNVAGDLSYVATDRWAQRAAFNSLDDATNNRMINRKGVRDDMIDAYKAVAEWHHVDPAVMQAIVWVVVRGSAE